MPDNVPAGHVVIRTTGFEELLQKNQFCGSGTMHYFGSIVQAQPSRV